MLTFSQNHRGDSLGKLSAQPQAFALIQLPFGNISLRRAQSSRVMSKYKRSAFTLVELLVVIAIIGILVALLLPAVQAAREAARRASCINNVMQLGLAAHNYEFHNEALPPGVTDTKGPIRNEPQGLHVSWLVKLLPFIEETAMYRKFDQSKGAYATENAAVRKMPLSIAICPSYPGEETVKEGTIAVTTYAGCYHDVEAPIDADNHGLMFLNSKVHFDEIYDGSTHTLLIGETREERDRADENLGWVSGTRWTLRNTSKIEVPTAQFAQPQPEDDQEKPQDVAASLYVGGFGGHHPGGFNAVFADGATHFITETVDPAVWRLVGNRADGELIQSF
jgi:prepilin-type N-terminal cleavage/methylation domain-containing protein